MLLVSWPTDLLTELSKEYLFMNTDCPFVGNLLFIVNLLRMKSLRNHGFQKGLRTLYGFTVAVLDIPGEILQSISSHHLPYLERGMLSQLKS